MSIEEKTLLELLKQSQFVSSGTINYDDVDIDVLYDEASIQTVLGLIATEIPPEFINEKWHQAQFRQKANYIRYCNAEDELVHVLDKEHIPFVILKGNAAAVSYNDPTCRSMGDIDFIVPKELFEKTRKILLENGYLLEKEAEYYTRHISFSKNGYCFELHRCFSHEDINIEEFISNGIKNRLTIEVFDHIFPILPKIPNGLVLLDHMRNHLKNALGLRQVVDWMMYVYRNLDDDFWNNEFGPIVIDLGMDTLAKTATRMCQIYLGLPDTITWCKDADENTCQQLMNCILVSGNFGRKNGQGKAVESVSLNVRKKGFFRFLQTVGERNWLLYQKHHWLKPFCWCYQLIRYTKKGFKSGRTKTQLKEDLERSNERYELLKKLGIE